MFSFFFFLFFCFALLCLVFYFISQQLIIVTYSAEKTSRLSVLVKRSLEKPPLLNEPNTWSNDIVSDFSEVLKENKLLYKSTAQISK